MGKVHALFADAPAPVDPIPELETRLAAALEAEARARREHGAACLDRERGDDKVDVSATAERLHAAVSRRQDVEAAIEAAHLASHATQAERQAAAERTQWARTAELLDRRAEAVAALQRAADAFATTLMDVHGLTVEIWNAVPRRPPYMTPAWGAMARVASQWLYGRTDGLFGAHGVPASPYVIRTERPDLVAQAAVDRALIEGMRRD